MLAVAIIVAVSFITPRTSRKGGRWIEAIYLKKLGKGLTPFSEAALSAE